MKIIFVILFFLNISFFTSLYAQDSLLVNKKYFEDQVYFSVGYNSLLNKPDTFISSGLSSAIHFGFIKDIPINNKRTIAIGTGLGYGYENFKNNLRLHDNQFEYITTDYLKNKTEWHQIEFPIELRYRNSTPTVYKFWRVYAGFKVAYIFSAKAIYQDESIRTSTNYQSKIEAWQFGPQLSVGYNSLNLYLYKNLNPFFKENNLSELATIKQLQFGLIVYMF